MGAGQSSSRAHVTLNVDKGDGPSRAVAQIRFLLTVEEDVLAKHQKVLFVSNHHAMGQSAAGLSMGIAQ